MLRLITISILLIISSLTPPMAHAFDRITTINSLQNDLSEARNSKDSITILYDIFDLETTLHRNQTGEMLYNTALASGNMPVAFDMLRQLTSTNSTNDSITGLMLSRAKSLPASEEQRQTVLFISITKAASDIPRMDEKERHEHLTELIKKSKQAKSEIDHDIYSHIEYLFNLCSYLYTAEEGSVLDKHLTELKNLIDSLPAGSVALRNAYYTRAANAYMNSRCYDKAIEADKTLLEIIDGMEKKYRSDGRRFRDLSRYKYVCYRRLLNSYKSLKPEEVDIYYNRVLTLAAQNPEVANSMKVSPRPTICYLMAKKRYDEVLPLVKPQIEASANDLTSTFFIEVYKEAADSAGTDAEQLEALRLYTDVLSNRLKSKTDRHFRELQVRYDIDRLIGENQSLELEKRNAKLVSHRKTIIYIVVALAGAIILLIIVYILYRRTKRLAKDVIDTNATLKTERDNLKATQEELIEARDKAKNAERVKTDFINNMSHEIKTPLHAIVEYTHLITDCVDAEKKKYLTRFTDIITLNTELLLTIVNDVLDIASIENSKMSVRIRTESVKSICRFAIDSTNKYLNPGVKMIFENADEPDISIKTDAHRTEQVLLNLLVNAAKFTKQGSISLGYQLTSDGKSLEFSVTDTGCGIPRGSEEIIFERFRQLSSQDQGCGLGLYISRLIARLLNGDVEVDTSYRKGARFIFRLPVY